ncbi:MAG: hypothetical protein O2807_03840 [bacterium]|nr:hypothetical protein [bacterium]
MEGENLVSILSAGLTPVLGLTMLYIAYQQYRTNHIRLQHELFDRRVYVFRGVRRHLTIALAKGALNFDDLGGLSASTAEIEFLFEKDLCEYIDEIYSRSIELAAISSGLQDENLGQGKKRSELTREKTEAIDWFSDQSSILKDKFSKYLKVS